jgi:hypothetical protein
MVGRSPQSRFTVCHRYPTVYGIFGEIRVDRVREIVGLAVDSE